MKELSIEQKAIAYDKLVERVKIEKEKSRNLGLLEFIENNFPELHESEDKKIKKDIIAAVETYGDFTQCRKEEIYTWLEKQGKETSTEWSTEDEVNLYEALSYIKDDALKEFIRSLKYYKKWKPSEEQITWLYRAADDASKDSRMKQILNELLSDLKKLK